MLLLLLLALQDSLPQLGPREGDGPSSQHGGVFLSDAKLHDVAGLLAKRGLDCSYAGASVLSCRYAPMCSYRESLS
jgi:hypothetical protein